jgi:hypothetical protein
MSHLSSNIKNLLDGFSVFFSGLAVVVIMSISYVILLVRKVLRIIGLLGLDKTT